MAPVVILRRREDLGVQLVNLSVDGRHPLRHVIVVLGDQEPCALPVQKKAKNPKHSEGHVKRGITITFRYCTEKSVLITY